MRFTKMHGIGNDYVYVDCITNPPPRDPSMLSKAISDRHFGVGADGLILICPSERADVRMRMFNADGSEAEMCGNGIRCVAKYVFDHGLVKKSRITIETGRGVLTLDLELKNGKVERVIVDMGAPILEAEKIPTTLSGQWIVDAEISVLAESDNPNRQRFLNDLLQKAKPLMLGTCVSMGNPHVVIYLRDISMIPLESLGPLVERSPLFPQRINVHFVQVHSPGEVTMRTWERGSGITLACGTGASAVCVAGVLTGRTERKILAHLPGGDLELEWSQDYSVYMTGPAVEVFSGEWEE